MAIKIAAGHNPLRDEDDRRLRRDGAEDRIDMGGEVDLGRLQHPAAGVGAGDDTVFLGDGDGVVHCPRAGAIDHQRHVRPASLAGGAHDGGVVFVQFDEAIAARLGFMDFIHHGFFDAVAQEARIRGQCRARAAAKQFVQRHAGALGPHIRNRLLERTDHRTRDQAARRVHKDPQLRHQFINRHSNEARSNAVQIRDLNLLPTVQRGFTDTGQTVIRCYANKKPVSFFRDMKN